MLELLFVILLIVYFISRNPELKEKLKKNFQKKMPGGRPDVVDMDGGNAEGRIRKMPDLKPLRNAAAVIVILAVAASVVFVNVNVLVALAIEHVLLADDAA